MRYGKNIKGLLRPASVAVLALWVGSCNKSTLSGGSKQKIVSSEQNKGGSENTGTEIGVGQGGEAPSPPVPGSGTGGENASPPELDMGVVSKTVATDDGKAPIRVFKETTKASSHIKELEPQSDQFAWTVTQLGTVTLHKIADKKIASSKKWVGGTPTNPGGARTYVIEGGGLVFARSGGEMFFVDPAMPEGTNLRTLGDPYYVALGNAKALVDAGKPIAPTDRVCVVSYKRDGKRYVGFGWGAGNFAEVPQKDTPPFAPIWQEVKYKGSAGAAAWGYSCYIDQAKLIYYGRFVGQSQMQAFDIKNSTAATPSVVASNGLFTSNTLPNLSIGPKTSMVGSYAISGDSKGNVFNGNLTYTMSYEPKNKVVWQTSSTAREITVVPADCLSTQAACAGHATFPLTNNIGPISALGDGTLVGVTRYAPTYFLYLLELVDPTNPSKGLNPPIQLAQLDSDPYMYTDYTGATLYLTKSEIKIKLADGGYDTSLPLRALGYTWLTKDNTPAPWTDMSLEVRCYLSSAPPPAYDPVAITIKPSTEQTVLNTQSCLPGTKNIDSIDVRLTQLNAATTLMNVRKIQVTGYQ